MKALSLIIVSSLSLISLQMSAQTRDKALTKSVLEQLQADSKLPDKSLVEKLRNCDILNTVTDSSVLASADTSCTYRVHWSGVTDQKNSGRCWIFSTFNILRAEVIDKYDLDGFEFSQTYIQFWDLMEKSNHFLENVIRYRHQPIDNRMNAWLFNKPFGDGGHFMNAAHIIDKYGVVPQEIMPERYSSTDNKNLMNLVRKVLRGYSMDIRRAPRSEVAGLKLAALTDVYTILCETLGTPPTEFDYSFMAHSAASHTVDPQTAAVAGPISFMASVDSKVATRSTPSGHYTPLTFRDAFIKHNLESDYVVLMNDPNLKYYRTYRVDESRNCYEYADWTFLNLPMSDLEKLGIASLKGGSMFYFSADTDKDGRDAAGVYDLNLLPIDSRLGVHSQMSKADMMASAQSSSLHAIAMCGVKTEKSEASNSSDNMTAADISDEKPVYWLAENSYGPGRGWDGTIVLSADWLNTYLFRMAIDRKYVPANLQALASKRPHKLPAWHLGY
jgi:bleomycin hydrolase